MSLAQEKEHNDWNSRRGRNLSSPKYLGLQPCQIGKIMKASPLVYFKGWVTMVSLKPFCRKFFASATRKNGNLVKKRNFG